MSDQIRNQYTPDIVTPPGETLLEALQLQGMTQSELADRTGRPTKTINEIIKGKAAITPETAIQFELVLGIPAAFWNNRESQYREHLARVKAAERFEEQAEWLDAIPHREMTKAGWIPETGSRTELLQHVLRFFGVASPSSWEEVWSGQQVAFRQSKRFQIDQFAVAAWLRKGEVDAQKLDSAPYDANRFRQALQRIRKLTRGEHQNLSRVLNAECREAGVRVVIVRELPKTRVWGATRWLSPTCALIQLSLRYGTDDHFWFTFFHECGHALLHGKREFFVDFDDQEDSQRELEANAFARDWLIPPDAYKAFRRRGARSCGAVSRFADEWEIAAGIVVGRLQHDGVLPMTHCNDLKRPVTGIDPEE